MLRQIKVFLLRRVYRFLNRRTWKGHSPAIDFEDLQMPTANGQLKLRLYRGINNNDLPLILFFHGGGWVIGDLDSHHNFCQILCESSACSVLAVDYRLAPEHPYPAAADDCLAATDWVAGHLEELGPSNGKIVLAGDSAGGNLATATCLELEAPVRQHVIGEVLIYPATDHYKRNCPSFTEKAKGHRLTSKMMKWFWDTYLGTADPDQQASYFAQAMPLQAANLSSLPATLLITAENDPLRDEGEAYADELRQLGVDIQFRNFRDVDHGFVCSMGPSQGLDSFLQDLLIWLQNLEYESALP
jgi:acetyl esterase